jgi:hypothetical protein
MPAATPAPPAQPRAADRPPTPNGGSGTRHAARGRHRGRCQCAPGWDAVDEQARAEAIDAFRDGGTRDDINPDDGSPTDPSAV